MLGNSDIKFREIPVHYLRMDRVPNYSTHLRDHSIEMRLMDKPVDPRYYLELYQRVGLNYDWVDRLVIRERELERLINRDEVDIFGFFSDDDPCGYVEYVKGIDCVEILYFGLFPRFIGKGMGATALRMAVLQAWSYEPEWIELNTCDLDNDNALSTYLNAGFEIYTTKIEKRRTIF